MDFYDKKAQLRSVLIQRRSQIRAERRTRYSQTIQRRLMNLPEFRTCRSVFCFVSLAEEVDTHGLLDSMLGEGKLLAVPKIVDSKEMIFVPFKYWSELLPGQMGILTPVSTIPYKGGTDICITPGIGFSENGRRLGYGRGCYDKWFATHTVKCKIAIAFECQILDKLPTGTHDIAVDIIVTEERIIRIR